VVILASLIHEIAEHYRKVFISTSVTDKAIFAAVTVGLFLITLVGSYIPAWRATKVNPLQALRHE